jgi:hypothetical protein
MTGNSSKRNRGEAPGLKVLFSAGALAATLSGWAILGIKDARAATGSSGAASGQEVPPEVVVLLQPLPTVVPPPAQLNIAAPVVQPTPMRQILRSVSIPPPAPAQADGKSRSSR